jgi:N-succinyldiaminopimelate aminotransferase
MSQPASPRPRIADRLAPFGTNIFTTITALANQHQAVNLSQGFPDFDGPEFIRQTAAEALLREPNQYAPMPGVPALRRAIAERFTRDTGLPVDADASVTVTCGCTEALPAAVFGTYNPGDGVILFEPFFDIHRSSIVMAGCRPIPVTLHRPQHAAGVGIVREPFRFDEAQLRAAFASGPRAILVNTPHNPTGKVFTREELQLIADLCIAHDVIAICDDVYERLTFDPVLPHVHLATLPGMAERTITLSSAGKTFSLTGWKIGWAVAPPELTRSVRAAHQFLTFSVAPALQIGIAAALAREAECVSPLVATLRANRDLLADALVKLGCDIYFPPSGYFVMADIAPLGESDDFEFVQRLIATRKVAAIPASAFYHTRHLGRTLVRFAFCKRPETVAEGIRRMAASIG